MKLKWIKLNNDWAIRQRQVLIREMIATPDCVRSLIDSITNYGKETTLQEML